MTSWWDPRQKTIIHKNINACIVPLCFLHGYAVTTIEGVGSQQKGLHPLQENMVACHGVQCGFCAPGMIMSAFTLSQTETEPSQERLEQSLEGNLCRCTGYRPIIESFKSLCKDCEETCADIEDICKIRTREVKSLQKTPNGDYTFSSDLQDISSNTARFVSGDMVWIRPTTLQEVLQLLADIPGARIVMGATAMSYGLKKGHVTGSTLICCSHVQEMNVLTLHNNVLEVGAGVDLASLESHLDDIISVDKKDQSDTCLHALKESLRWLGSNQIKNMSTIGGHLGLCDPRSDLFPVLMALGATAVVASKGRQSEVLINDNFISGPWKTSLKDSEVIVSVRVPVDMNTKAFYYKQAKRKSFDYAIANACFTITLAGQTVTSARLYFGGIGQTFISASNTASTLIGKTLNSSTFENVRDTLTEDLKQTQTETEPVNKFKLQLGQAFLRKFWNQIATDVQETDRESQDWGTSTGTQVWEAPSPNQPEHDAVGKPIPVVGGPALVTGEATFIDDIPRPQGEIWVELVCSKKAHAKILSLDVTNARKVPGFIDFMDSSWIPGRNEWGIIVQDDVLFATSEVHFYGQPVGAILAETEQAAKKAARMVEIQYEDLPALLTIKDAIAWEAFIPFKSKPLQVGDPEAEFENCDIVREGVIQSGYQEHMYMEPNAAVVIPHEDDELEVFITTQSQQFCQKAVAELINIPSNRVTVRTKRVGGAFGGKEFRVMYVLGPAAVAAYRTGRTARCILDRSTDVMLTGKRHPFLTEYKAGFNTDGKLKAVKLKIFVDAGYSVDVTTWILNKVMFHVDGSYKIPNFRVDGWICRTHTPSNTTFRGFGAPEGAYIIETLLADSQSALTVTPEQIRATNLYKEGDSTHYRAILTDCNIEKCWNECKKKSNFDQKKEDVKHFNKAHTWRKRGIALMPSKCSVSYPNRAENQGSALVNVYLDGSVLLSHGGIEMGQGLHTKMIQVASRALGIPMEKVHTSDTGTHIIPNSISSAASFSTDIFGEAVLNACTTLRERLAPLVEKNPQISWTDLVQKAFAERISLSATGYCRIGNHHWDFEKGEGNPYHYYTFGAACSVVEIDCLTGAHQVLSTDIVMDVGKSLNPGIDVGQIEGAFVQGYGWLTSEEILVEANGRYNISGPVDYKIPNVKDIPREIRVSLLKDCPNERAVYSSKGIGEPPLLLSISVYLALRDAIDSARGSAGLSPLSSLNIPVTAEAIRSTLP
ncbi:xanthine dehydrogenase/oxidase-like [Ylistrum balloti]|uniref:xanthine dehydrogenase/oxidase-like n=1 Tax=Ylistrum balloti TaxID=509963 RepID=UPI002905BCE5|nr:xanthine dehydrogenase/oxidase-like [Ylistrum balloti]